MNNDSTRHPASRSSNETSAVDKDPMLQFFSASHLPDHLRPTSEMFAGVANAIVNTLPRNPERTVALRKLLEAKDCAVRAILYK